MKKRNLVILPLVFMVFPVFSSIGQQVPDTAYEFAIYQAAYQKGEGSVVFIDETHNNFHTKNGGFSAFSKLLGQDGYQVQSLSARINNENVLKNCKILVIANALDSSNADKWVLPTPSAFSDEEIRIIRQWVQNGGCLLLIADHMPFAGAACMLGKAFGFEFLNGFARTRERAWPPSVFSLKEGTLRDSPVTRGLRDYEKIDSVVTFTGSAFKTPEGSIHVLRFMNEHYSLQPDTAWSFNKNTSIQKLEGFYQGALLICGHGKVAVFGEAAMFTAQIANGNFKVGMNSESAPQNAQFTLNLIHWLDGVKEYRGVKVQK